MVFSSPSKIFCGILIGIGISFLFQNVIRPPCYTSSDSKYIRIENTSSSLLSDQRKLQKNFYARDWLPINERNDKSDDIKERVKRIRVVCYIMTHPPNHNTNVKAVRDTWGKRCDKIIFISNANDSSLPAISVGLPATRTYNWGKTKRGFTYVYKNFFKDGDWFLKADDDTYVIMENLKLVLSQYDTKKPLYLGCRYNKFTPQGYMSGGAGYVLSKEALRRLIEEGLSNPAKCKKDDTGSEDVETGKCLYNIGVKATDSRDAVGSYRFFPLDLDYYTHGHIPAPWFWDYIFYTFREDRDRCSATPISWHYIKDRFMYFIDYLIYNVTVYGLQPVKLGTTILYNKTNTV